MNKKMTPAPWEMEEEGNHSIHISSSDQSYTHVIATLYTEPMSEDTRSNAAAIVSAVNNTYGQQINPESVPNMMKSLEAMLKAFSHIGGVGHDEKKKATLFALEAIEKSKL